VYKVGFDCRKGSQDQIHLQDYRHHRQFHYRISLAPEEMLPLEAR